MALNLVGTSVSKLYVTGTEVTKMYFNGTEVYSSGQAPSNVFDNYTFVAGFNALTDVQDIAEEGNVMSLMPKGTVTATSVHSTPILAIDKDGIYKEYPADTPVWKGVNWNGGAPLYDDLPDVYLQANKAVTNNLLWSEDLTNAIWETWKDAVATTPTTVHFPNTAAFIQQTTSLPAGDAIATMWLSGAGTINVAFYDGAFVGRSTVTLTNELAKYVISSPVAKNVRLYIGRESSLSDTGSSGTATDITLQFLQLEIDSSLGSPYVPTTTAAASIPATNYTFPAANIDPSDSLIEFDMNWAGDDTNVLAIGATQLLEIISGNLTLSDGTNSVALPVVNGNNTISVSLTATTMTLTVNGSSDSGPHVPIAAGLITLSEDAYDLRVAASEAPAAGLTPSASLQPSATLTPSG